MKAFLLAAGHGTRLRPLTDTVPKCLVPIGDDTLLDIWLDALAAAGVDEVLVNLHHLPGVVDAHLAARAGPPATTTFYEPDLLGSAGTLAANREWVKGEDEFFVCYADVLTDFDLRSLLDVHRSSGATATLALFRTDRPSSCGIVSVDDTGWMTAFEEKPAHPSSNLANAGMYVFDPCVVDEISAPPPRDIGYELMPRLAGRAQTVMVTGYLEDIGTPEAHAQAQATWPLRSR